ncbi:MAG: hypothetical protein GY808_12780 [Gammaproteobacteria bacterium]|nr:hypothetical protein [Gammaproteobacteria bacterium]
MVGSSVPGSDSDAARGTIVAREGNSLTIRGATLIREDDSVSFNDEISVLISETTKVRKHRGMEEETTIDALSVGQSVSIRGSIIADDAGRILDASEGAIRMHINSISGHAVNSENALLVMDLQAINGRLPEIYDFSGTGIDETFYADPENYEISTLNLMDINITTDTPVRLRGYVCPFGTAPVDFEARAVMNYEDSNSKLHIDWPDKADVVAFSEISVKSLTINIANNGEDGIYQLIQGGIRTDLTSFDSAVVIQPAEERSIYTIRTGDTVSALSNFADFVTILELKLSEGQIIDRLHAQGGFSTSTSIFIVRKLAIKLSSVE